MYKPAAKIISQKIPEIRVEPCLISGARELFAERYQTTHKRPFFGLLFCTPIGYERERSYPSIDAACRQLAACGGDVLRIDYSGTGESAGELEQLRLSDWKSDIHRAANWLREKGNWVRLDAVGMRMGAPLLMAAQLHGLERITLWDPVMCGGSHLREQRHLQRNVLEDPQRFPSSESTNLVANSFESNYHNWMHRDLNHLILATHAMELDSSARLLRPASTMTVSQYLRPLEHHRLTERQIITFNEQIDWNNPIPTDKPMLLPSAVQHLCDPYVNYELLRPVA